jgi:hypothetical protein
MTKSTSGGVARDIARRPLLQAQPAACKARAKRWTRNLLPICNQGAAIRELDISGEAGIDLPLGFVTRLMSYDKLLTVA